MAVQTQIQTRRGTAATWTSTNPTLAAGEIGFETDTNKFKIGTGSTAWTALAYAANTSPLTTKGDLYTYSTTNDRLAVGPDGSSIVADSSTSTGLRYQGSMPAGKNVFINGGFDIWQRGTSFASTAGYLADRWTNSSAVNAITVTRQSTTPANSSQYYMRLTSTSNGSYMNLYQYIETANAQTLWGQTATFSIKMRKNSTTTLTSISFGIDKSATADAGSGATWTSLGSSSATIASMSTTTWTTYTLTFTVPNDGTANSLRIALSMNGTETSGGYVEYSEAQLELGSVATTFARAGGTIQGELAACQRYYYDSRGAGLATSQAFSGPAITTSYISSNTQFKSTMRTSPTIILGDTSAVNNVRQITTNAHIAVTPSSYPGVCPEGISGLSFTGTPVTIGVYYDFYLVMSAEL